MLEQDAIKKLLDAVSYTLQELLSSPDNKTIKYELQICLNALGIASRLADENNDASLARYNKRIQTVLNEDLEQAELLDQLEELNKQALSISNPKFVKTYKY